LPHPRATLFPYTTLFRSPRSTAKVFTEGQGLVLIRGAQADPVDPFRPRPEPLEPDLERGLAVVDQERHLPGPHFHNHLRAQNARSEEHTSELQSRFDLVC